LRFIHYIKRKLHERRSKKEKENSAERADRITANATFAIAFLTAVIAIVGILQYMVFSGQLEEMRTASTLMKGQLNLTSDLFRMSERAWIEISPIKSALFHPRDDKFPASFNYEISIKNTGKSVARDIKIRSVTPSTGMASGADAEFIKFNQDIMLGKIPTAADISVNKAGPRALAPNAALAIPFVPHGQEPDTRNPQWVNYLIGRIDYADIFEIPHWVTFCFFVIRRGELQYCQEGNDQDHNTKHTPN